MSGRDQYRAWLRCIGSRGMSLPTAMTYCSSGLMLLSRSGGTRRSRTIEYCSPTWDWASAKGVGERVADLLSLRLSKVACPITFESSSASSDALDEQPSTWTTDSEWQRLREQARAAGMSTSRYIVHRLSEPTVGPELPIEATPALPLGVQLRVARELLVLAEMERLRMGEMERLRMGEARDGEDLRGQAVAEVDAWLDAEMALG